MDFEILTNSPIIFYTALAIGAVFIVLGFPSIIVIILGMFILGITYSVIGLIQGYVLGPIVIIILSSIVLFFYSEVILTAWRAYKKDKQKPSK